LEENHHFRRVASNYLVIGNRRLVNHVVELLDGLVVNYYPLQGEIAMTEWLGGTITITQGKAYHNDIQL
jgi:hypothetical protein